MKIRKFNESYSVSIIKNIIDDYNKLTQDIKPAVIEKYIKLANDKNYEPDQGDKPIYFENPQDWLIISECYINEGEFLFILYEFDKHREVLKQYYIYLNEEEMEEALMRLDAKKYNL